MLSFLRRRPRSATRLSEELIARLVLYSMSVLVAVVISIQLGDAFFNRGNLISILDQIPEFALFSLAMGLTMISGGIDLSVIAVANLSGVLAAEILTNPALMGALGTDGTIALAVIAAIASAALMGLLNGVIIFVCGMPALLATLGTMMLYAGLGTGLTGGVGITGMPPGYVSALSARIAGVVPVSFLVILILFVLTSAYVRTSVFGRTLYLYGENKVAALFSGLRMRRSLILSYVASGVLAGLAGLVMLARFNSMKIGFGDTFLMQAILVAVLAGIDPFGGRGRLLEVLITVVMLQCVENAFTILGFSPYAKKMIWGGMLLLFMAINYFVGKSVDRALTAAIVRQQRGANAAAR
jgi:simple sugar transport system permease protein